MEREGNNIVGVTQARESQYADLLTCKDDPTLRGSSRNKSPCTPPHRKMQGEATIPLSLQATRSSDALALQHPSENMLQFAAGATFSNTAASPSSISGGPSGTKLQLSDLPESLGMASEQDALRTAPMCFEGEMEMEPL